MFYEVQLPPRINTGKESSPFKTRKLLAALTFALTATLCISAQTSSEILDQADHLAETFSLAKAQPLYRQAEVTARTSGNQPDEMRAKLGQIRYRVQKGSYTATRQELRKILEMPAVSADPTLKIRALDIVGNIDLNQNTPAALQDWTEVLGTAKSIGDTKWVNRANGYLGLVAGLSGDIGGAAKALFQAMGTAEKLNDIPGELTFGIWLANGMSTNGMADNAGHMLDRVEAAAKRAGYQHLPMQFSIARVRALAALPNGEGNQRAKELLKAAVNEARDQGIPGAEADLLGQSGEMAMQEGDYKQAEEAFSHQVNVAKHADLPSLQAGGLLNLSKLYRLRTKNTQAELAINEGIQVVRRVEESYDLPNFIAEKAEVELALGRPKTADTLYDQATHLVEGLLVNAPSSRIKSAMVGSMGEIYVGHFRLAWNQWHDASRAFQIIESARGRALLSTLGSAQASNGRVERSAAEIQIARLQSKLLHTRLGPTETKRVLDQLDRAYDDAFSRQPGEPHENSSQSAPVSLAALQRKLEPGETLVEYILDAPNSYAMEITAAQTLVHSLPARSEIKNLTKQYLSAINANGDTRVPGKALYKSLISELKISNATSLIVVPDGALHNLPFGALIDGKGKYISQTLAVSSAPSASVYSKLKASGTTAVAATKAFLGVAYSPEMGGSETADASTRGLFDLRGADLKPLPFAREEVNNAAAILGNGAVVLDESNASEKALKSQPLKDFKIIHLAAHAIGNELEPDRAAVVLAAGGGDDDGLWQAREIRRTRLNADLVVLSACETGIGRLQGEEGVMNLARAFLSSGAGSVVASLWRVQDRSTATVMESFYKHLNAGLSISESLRQAQLDFIKDYGPMAKPNLWAGLEVIGDGTRRINFATSKLNNRAAR